MAEQSEADTLFDRLLALNRDAFAARRYPTAYYALVAAMCEAEAAQEVPALVLVQTVAEAQAAPGERPVASPPTSTYSTLLTLLAKRIQHRVVLIQRWRLRHDRPPCCSTCRPSSTETPAPVPSETTACADTSHFAGWLLVCAHALA